MGLSMPLLLHGKPSDEFHAAMLCVGVGDCVRHGGYLQRDSSPATTWLRQNCNELNARKRLTTFVKLARPA
jgi:hypothetical protein